MKAIRPNEAWCLAEVRGPKYNEAQLLDHKRNLTEGPEEKLFLVKEGPLYTPPPGAILPGITRATIIEAAEGCGIAVDEQELGRDDLFDADEAFSRAPQRK